MYLRLGVKIGGKCLEKYALANCNFSVLSVASVVKKLALTFNNSAQALFYLSLHRMHMQRNAMLRFAKASAFL
jgi:hypothetical protein